MNVATESSVLVQRYYASIGALGRGAATFA